MRLSYYKLTCTRNGKVFHFEVDNLRDVNDILIHNKAYPYFDTIKYTDQNVCIRTVNEVIGMINRWIVHDFYGKAEVRNT